MNMLIVLLILGALAIAVWVLTLIDRRTSAELQAKVEKLTVAAGGFLKAQGEGEMRGLPAEQERDRLHAEAITRDITDLAEQLKRPTWLSRNVTIQSASAVGAFLFVLYQLLAGAFMASASLELSAAPVAEVKPADASASVTPPVPAAGVNAVTAAAVEPKANAKYAVKLKIKRNNQWAIRLYGAYVQLRSCHGSNPFIVGDEVDKVHPSGWRTMAQTISFTPMDNEALRKDEKKDLNGKLVPAGDLWSDWSRRTPAAGTWGTGYADIRYAMAPGEEAVFHVVLEAPPGETCTAEVTVAYKQFSFLETKSVLFGSVLLSPTPEKDEKAECDK